MQAGGFISVRTGGVPDANATPVRKANAEEAMDAAACIGCGACEYACPVKDRPAVYVTSVGESRSRANQFILQPPSRHG